MKFGPFGKKSNKEIISPRAVTQESLFRMKFNLRQVNNLLRLADIDIDPSNPESFRINSVDTDVFTAFLTQLDLVNSVDVDVNLIDDPNSQEFSNLMKRLQQVKTTLSQKTPQEISFSVIWAELIKTFFKFGKILDLDDEKVLKAWLTFRQELIHLIAENGLQDKLKVQKCALNFIGQLEKEGHTLSARAIHNFIYIFRKTMIANFACDKDKDANAYGVLAAPSLLFGLELESTMILANSKIKFDPSYKSTREYVHMRLLSSALIDFDFFDKPYQSSMYQFLFQHDVDPSLDAIASLSILNENDTRGRSSTAFQSLQNMVENNDLQEIDLAAKITETDFNERFKQFLLTSPPEAKKTEKDKSKDEHMTCTSFLTSTGAELNINKRGSMVKQEPMLPQYMMQNVRNIFQDSHIGNMNPSTQSQVQQTQTEDGKEKPVTRTDHKQKM